MSSPGIQALLFAASAVAAVLAGLRWLRVAQREHYLPGSVIRFARRWWSTGPNRMLGVAALAGLLGATAGFTPAGLVSAAAVAAGPFGLSVRGRTSALVWTARLRLVAVVAAGLASGSCLLLVLLLPGWKTAAAVTTLVAYGAPFAVDLALRVTARHADKVAARFVEQAKKRLATVAPKVVAITGSYGKTSTKGYVAHLLSGSVTVVPTPKSFNNNAGLSRAVNEHLVPGTDVFVAEMGTYGPGEIATMCAWVPPDVAVITAIGPVHLERMGSEEVITKAKAEILERAPVVVLNIDSPWLAPLADQAAAEGKKVWRCSSSDLDADVCVLTGPDGGRLRVLVKGPDGHSREIADAPGGDAPAGNVACAVAVALELGVAPEVVAARLPGLPVAPHRREIHLSERGATIIDDTYNANPAGARAALAQLARLFDHIPPHKAVVVTPGMVELGNRQAAENGSFAEEAAAIATHLLVIGHTNGPALINGWQWAPQDKRAQLLRFATRPQAVAWVVANAGPGDVVLYENDLPDHFP